ncbi:MAG: helicase C-terminal domain-containing protein [Calditrichaceae bacterium]
MAIRIENDHIFLGVRDLIRSSRQPQLLSSFPLPQRGMLGRKAHDKVRLQKNNTYGLFHSEYSLRREYNYRDFTFVLQGRIDGVYQLKNKVEVEEIKSVILTGAEFKRLDIRHYPEFIEQVSTYGYMLQDELEGVEVSTHLILVNLINDARRKFDIPFIRQNAEKLLFHRFDDIIEEMEHEKVETALRMDALNRISFDLPEKRPQQRQMIERIEADLNSGAHSMVSAPTGTGKTAASIFPAIRYAIAHNKKIFFVTSKTTQQNIVRETVEPLIGQGLDFKVLYLRASEKMCANDIYFCHEAHCKFAKDYRDRMDETDILQNLLEENILTPEIIYQTAVEKTLCPFEVSMDISAHCDMIVGDYNYVFDPAVFIRRLFAKKDYSDWILIIDEAHNLYERGMDYLSPEIGRENIGNLIKWHHKKKEKIFRDLIKALREIDDLMGKLNLEGEIHFSGQQYFKAELNIPEWDNVFTLFESVFLKYLIHKIKNKILIMDDPIEQFYYKIRRFVKIAHFTDRAFVPFYDASAGGILKIRCCDPSDYLGQRMDGFHSVIAMSATLDPMDFYQEVLGLGTERTSGLRLDSPFSAKNRKVVIVPGISTRYKDRMNSYARIAEVIENTINIKSGNYLVFFPGYDYLQNVNIFLGKVKSEKIIQKAGLNETERDEILRSLNDHSNPHLLLGVMGGVFSEGVDYRGDMAIGVIIVSPGLPKVSYERELLREYYEEKQNQGMEYAFIYPGMNKVIQSVGRLIRSATDKGIIVLVGERFTDDLYNAILPDYWFEKHGDIEITENYEQSIRLFWKRFE